MHMRIWVQSCSTLVLVSETRGHAGRLCSRAVSSFLLGSVVCMMEACKAVGVHSGHPLDSFVSAAARSCKLTGG